MSPGGPKGGDGKGGAPPFRNPGWAGNTGEFDLTEEQVRGIDFVGERPLAGGHAAGAAAYPYMLAEKDPDAPLFEGPYHERFEKILTRYPDTRAALLPTLNLAEEVRGHVSPGTMDRVAELLELPAAYVRGVTTFYTMYNKAPVGRYLVQVCTNISCNLCGADDVLAAFLRYTDTEMGETSEDGLFTVVEAECLAACGFPTCVQINSRYYENVTPDDVPAILEHLKAKGSGPAPGGSESIPEAAGDPA
ncbi:MAG: NAD(P)H-dependent oxidoreductase subunit E, partial [Gemmatimonadota bacterium]